MANDYFRFKQFTIHQDRCAFKVGTDGVILGSYADVAGTKSILDIGTGSGVIALMLAQRSTASITAIEPDGDSFEQAVENVKKSKWSKRIDVKNTGLQDFNPGMKFDMIVTNPPYFTDSLKNPDERKASARHNVNLTSAEILAGVSGLLADDGRFHLIMPYVEGNIFIAEAVEYGLYCESILKIRPLPSSGIRRLVLCFSRKRIAVTEKFLTIEKGKRHEFTEDYINLTKEFYLKF